VAWKKASSREVTTEFFSLSEGDIRDISQDQEKPQGILFSRTKETKKSYFMRQHIPSALQSREKKGSCIHRDVLREKTGTEGKNTHQKGTESPEPKERGKGETYGGAFVYTSFKKKKQGEETLRETKAQSTQNPTFGEGRGKRGGITSQLELAKERVGGGKNVKHPQKKEGAKMTKDQIPLDGGTPYQKKRG